MLLPPLAVARRFARRLFSPLPCARGVGVYLLYADESGFDDSDHFVVAGLAVHEQDAYPAVRAVESLFASLPARLGDAEIHTRNLRAGSGIWHSLDQKRRDRFIHDLTLLLLRDLPGSGGPPALFAVVLHRDSFPHYNPYERAYEEFFARCNGMLGRLASRGDRHRCVVIADHSRLESAIQSAMLGWRERGASTGAAIGPLSAYAEVPLFVDSKASRLVQLADFVAHWVYRAYEAGDDSVLARLVNGFDQEEGVLHGLVHLVRDHRACDCLACESRR